MDIRNLFFLFVLLSCSSAFAQLANNDIKSALVLSFNEVSLSGSKHEAVYLNMEDLCLTGSCTMQQVNALFENLPAANRNISTFLKRQDFTFNSELSYRNLSKHRSEPACSKLYAAIRNKSYRGPFIIGQMAHHI